jgi:hypothetical protein
MLTVLLKPLLLGWRGLRCAVRWWPVGFVALVLFLANVPGEKHSEKEKLGTRWTNSYYYHGWPGTYLERLPMLSTTSSCWQLCAGVVRFSGWVLLVNLLFSGGLLAATAFATSWLRPRLRPRFSLTTALAGLAAISLLMGYAARWRRDHLEMAQIARTPSNPWGMIDCSADCPTWLAELLENPPPDWLSRLDTRSLFEPIPSTPEAVARVSRAIELRRDSVELYIDTDHIARPWRKYIGQVADCENLEIRSVMFDGFADSAGAASLVRHFRKLRSLQINLSEDDFLSADDILIAIPRDRLRELILIDACLSYDNLATVAQCRQLETLEVCAYRDYGEPFVTGEGLCQLRTLVHLKNLTLQGSAIQIDERLSFRQFERLRGLTLFEVVNDGWSIADLAPLSELVVLDFYGTSITLADVNAALRLPHLQILRVENCGIDPVEIQRLQQAHPRVQITY